MTTQHTQGPWFITHEGYDHSGNYKHQIGTNEITVAYTWCPCDYSPPPSAMIANARLIAAAPELLEALRLVLNTYGFDSSTDSSVWQTVTNVIQKATNERG